MTNRNQNQIKELYEAKLIGSKSFIAEDPNDWFVNLRKDSVDKFISVGFPDRKNEKWKYLDLAPFYSERFKSPSFDSLQISKLSTEKEINQSNKRNNIYDPVDSYQLNFFNGILESNDKLKKISEKIEIITFAEAVKKKDRDVVEFLNKKKLNDGFAALNFALVSHGYFIRVCNKKLDRPIVINHYNFHQNQMPEYGIINFVSVKDSEISIIENFFGEYSPKNYFNNISTFFNIGNNSNIRYYKNQQEANSSYHISNINLDFTGRESLFEHFNLSLGANLCRNEYSVNMRNLNNSCKLFGIYLLKNNQQCDNTLETVHFKERCKTEEIFYGVLSGESKGIYKSNVDVRPGAMKADTYQLNKNLILSDYAQANSKPELNINSDDVKCSHGSASGELDQDALYYLNTRGIENAEARMTLLKSFLGEVIKNISIPEVRNTCDFFVERYLKHL